MFIVGQFGGILNSLMAKAERIQYQAALLEHGKVLIAPSFMMNWVGNPYLIDVGVGAFYRFIRL